MRDGMGIKEAKSSLDRLRGMADKPSLIGIIQEMDLRIDYADVGDPILLREIIRTHLLDFIRTEQARRLRRRGRVGLAWLMLAFIFGAGLALWNGYHLAYQPLEDRYEVDFEKVLRQNKKTADSLATAQQDTVAKLMGEIDRLKSQLPAAPPETFAQPGTPRPSPWSRLRRLQAPSPPTESPPQGE